ncbi:MAG TPA: uracil-DNA glycosylase family protein [Terriglobales bacterium]|jgi:DNA polymerase
MGDKQLQYSQLVKNRKVCCLCAPDLVNPNECEEGVFDQAEHIGAWSRWQGNLDASLMIIGQDWGGADFYVKYEGLGNDENSTNRSIRDLLKSIDISIELPQVGAMGSLFFTNSILCLRRSGLTGPTKSSWFKNCSKKFLLPQIELVASNVIATLGYKAYCSVMYAFGLPAKPKMENAVLETIRLQNGSLLVPLYHPGRLGRVSRTFEDQKLDWQRVRSALDGAFQ